MILITWPFRLLLIAFTSALLALGQIWTNKVRSTLTVIGIVIGIASVTAVIAALTGLKANVLKNFESIGTNKMYIFERYRFHGRFNYSEYLRCRFRMEHFDGLLNACPSVADFTRIASTSDPVSHGSHSEQSADITGIEPSWHHVENRAVLVGRAFSLVDIEQARAVCLVNPRTQERLALDSDPTGQSVLINKRRFIVVGVVEKSDNPFFSGGETRAEVFIPLSTMVAMNQHTRIMAVAMSRTPELSDDARAEIAYFLRHKRHIAPGEENNFEIEVIERYLQQFNKIATTTTLIATCVVGISLLVGGVGIMNIMLVSVSERTREIGLRKAVGARPSAILLQFLVEAVMLCLFGGALGLAGGQGLTSIIAHIPGADLERAYIPPWAILLAFGFSASVGLIFGMFPAVKAARLDPIEALRHE
ncbi:MAG: ABC transporter permease [Tepidisphaeraceae bacterium]|jgi:putative ABC transport system permease protein